MEAKEIINQFYKTEFEYNHLKRVNGYTFPIALCPINLKIINEKDRNDYFSKVVKISNVVEENCKHVVILAKAGCGKTTFCKQYTHLSQNSTDFPFNGQVIHISLRRLKSYPKQNKPYNLINVFENEFFSQKSNSKKLAKELFLDYEQNKDKYLFLLDGLDEVDHDITRKESHSMHKCLMYLLESSAEHYLIVTTRPYIPLKDYMFDLKLEIKKLDDSDISKLIYESCFEEDLRQKVLAYKNNSNVAKSLMRTPILLDMICICFEDFLKRKVDVEDFKLTTANLLKIIIEELWRMYLKKERIAWYDDHMNSEVLNTKMEKEQTFLEKLAFNQNKSNLIQFSRDDFTLESPNLFKSYIFQSEIDGKNKHVYSFVHFYFQDYFAAKYIINNIEKQEIIDFIRSNKYEERFLHVWKFVAGIADINCANQFFDLLEQHPRDLCGGFVHQRLILPCLNQAQSIISPSKEKRLALEHIKHLKFVHEISPECFPDCYSVGQNPNKVLEILLERFHDHEFQGYLCLKNAKNLPCKYLLNLLEMYKNYNEVSDETNINNCKSIIINQIPFSKLVFSKVCENFDLAPELWIEILKRENSFPEEIQNKIMKIILQKINKAVELKSQMIPKNTLELKVSLDDLEKFLLKSREVFRKDNLFQSTIELINESNKTSSTLENIQKLLPKVKKDILNKKNSNDKFKTKTMDYLIKKLEQRRKDTTIDLKICNEDQVFKLFEQSGKSIKESVIKNNYMKKYKNLKKSHIEILKNWIKNKDISDESKIMTILWIWNQEKVSCDPLISEEIVRFLTNKCGFYKQSEIYMQCFSSLQNTFYALSNSQRDTIIKVMKEFLSDKNCDEKILSHWIEFMIKALTIEDLEKVVSYFLDNKISIKCDIGNIWESRHQIPINLIRNLYAIFNDDFEFLKNKWDNLVDQVFIAIWKILEIKIIGFNYSSINTYLIKCLFFYHEVSDNSIKIFLQSKTNKIVHCEKMWPEKYNFLEWFLKYLQLTNEKLNDNFLSTMYFNVYNLSIKENSRWDDEIKNINSTFHIEIEPNFTNEFENYLRKCQSNFPNAHNDLSIYFRFHSPQERKKYLQRAIESCEPVNCSEPACVIYKNVLLGFLKIEIASNNKFCIDDFKYLLEKELKNFELVHLDLSKNKLTDCDLFNIIPLIKENTKLESIILSHNEITHKGLIDLLHDIKSEMLPLKCLFLDFNQIMLRQEDISCIPQEISNIIERIDLSMNFIPKEIWDKLTESSFSIYKSYYNHTNASIFPVKQREWSENFEGSIGLVYKNQWKPSHVFLLIDQINKEIGQRTITKVELTVNSNGEVNIREKRITNPIDFLDYIEKLEKKEYICRYALLTKEKFDKLFNKIEDLRSSQNFRDYSLLPYIFGNNCVNIMVEILKAIDIQTRYVISPKRMFF